MKAVAAGVDNAEHTAAQFERQLFDLRLGGGCKIHIRKAADGAGSLIHQPTGLAEKLVFSVLAAFGQLDRRHTAFVIEMAEDVAEHHLERGRGRQSRAGEHIGHRIGAKAACFAPRSLERGADTRDERRGGPAPARFRVGPADIGHILGIPLALKAYDTLIGRRCCGDDIDIHRRREHAAVLVVGMVAGYLRPSRHREQRRLAVAVDREEAVEQPRVARTLRLDTAFAVESGEYGIVAAVTDRLLQCCCFHLQ